MPLNEQQSIAAEVYGGGDFAFIESTEGAEGVGDTLFTAIIRELSDEEDCDSMDEAIQRMERAQADIQVVLDGLRIKQGELTSYQVAGIERLSDRPSRK